MERPIKLSDIPRIQAELDKQEAKDQRDYLVQRRYWIAAAIVFSIALVVAALAQDMKPVERPTYIGIDQIKTDSSKAFKDSIFIGCPHIMYAVPAMGSGPGTHAVGGPPPYAAQDQWDKALNDAIRQAVPMASPADTKRQLPIPHPPKAKVAAQRKECAWCPFINGRAADGHKIVSFSFHMNAD